MSTYTQKGESMNHRNLPGIKKRRERKLRLNLMLDQKVISKLEEKENMSKFVNDLLIKEFGL